jgi:hypothetical protein
LSNGFYFGKFRHVVSIQDRRPGVGGSFQPAVL